MRIQPAAAFLALFGAVAGCASNTQSTDTGAAARDTSITTTISDSTGAPEAEQASPDQNP